MQFNLKLKKDAMYQIHIIDDDKQCRDLFAKRVEKMNFLPIVSENIKSGLNALKEFKPDLVLLDVNLPDGSGLDIIDEIKNSDSSPEVIILTSESDIKGAEIAIDNGAWAYLDKVASNAQFKLNIERALQFHSERLKKEKVISIDNSGLIGSSNIFQKCMDFLALSSQSNANVLLHGETGTGKELFATAIHNNSQRKGKRFVVIDCASLPENLVESVLFGHEKGAFTGADSKREGLLKQADGGTLFLDEIGEMPLNLQKSFLRALQERRFRPVGSNNEIHSDFRLISATNRNLKTMVKEGTFRSDLLFRINSLSTELPSLRERKDDIKEITRFYAARFSNQLGITEKGFDSGYFEVLEQYNWPGNIRELVNVIETSIAKAGNSPTLYEIHLPNEMRVSNIKTTLPHKNNLSNLDSIITDNNSELQTLKDFCNIHKDRVEKHYLNKLRDISEGDVEYACKIADISRSRLYQLLKQHSMSIS